MHVYVYAYIYIYVHTYIYIHIYIYIYNQAIFAVWDSNGSEVGWEGHACGRLSELRKS